MGWGWNPLASYGREKLGCNDILNEDCLKEWCLMMCKAGARY